jgi:hypothetical protein
MMAKVSSSSNKNNNKCPLGSKISSLNKHENFNSSKGEELIIDGILYRFDAKDCATMFKRFRSVDGNKFEILGQEHYISESSWNKVIPSKQEIREIEKEA